MLLRRLSVVLRVDGEVVDSATECVSAGGYVLVLSTVIADRRVPVDLHSTYVGDRDGDTAVTHLRLEPRCQGGRLSCERRPPRSLPVGDDRAQCLFDHLSHLLATLKDLGHEARVDVSDDAVALVNA